MDSFRVDFSFVRCSIEEAENIVIEYMLIGEPMSKYKMPSAYSSAYQ